MNKYLIFIFLLVSSLGFCKPIEEFIQNDLNIKKFNVKQNASNDIVEGGKLSDIFFIENLDSMDMLVIKRFSKTEGMGLDFEKEKRAYEFFQNYSFSSFKTPTLVKSYEDEENSYLVLTKASGITLNHLLQKRKSIPFWKREEYDKNIKLAMKESAKALYELHQSASNQSFKKISPHSSSPTELAKRISASLKNPKIAANFEHFRKKVSNKPLKFGTCHGDLHLGNIFFDEHGKTVTLIDFSTLSGHEESLGKIPVAEEIATFIAYFEAIAYLHGINQKDTKLFLEEFKINYPEYASMYDEIAYFRQIALLRLIETCQDGSSDSYLDYQMRELASYSKKAIFFPLIS